MFINFILYLNAEEQENEKVLEAQGELRGLREKLPRKASNSHHKGEDRKRPVQHQGAV